MLTIILECTKWRLRIHAKAMDGNGTEQSAWMVSAPFSCKKDVNDGRIRTGERDPVVRKRFHTSQSNVIFADALFL